METLRGATVNTPISLPISQAAACGSAGPPMKPLCKHYSHLQKIYQWKWTKRQSLFPFQAPEEVIHVVEMCLEIFMVHIK